MKQKQYILHSLTIEVIAVLLASMIAFQICNMLSGKSSVSCPLKPSDSAPLC